MALNLKTYPQMLDSLKASWASSLQISPLLKRGDPALAIFRAFAGLLIYVLSQINRVYQFARASTSTGPDLDSFVADFGLLRLPARKATGQVTFSTASPAVSKVLISLGSIVQTDDATIQYLVVANDTLPAWSAADNAYAIQIGQSTADVAVEAALAGTASNVQDGALIQFGTSIVAVNGVTNASPIQDAKDEEDDVSLRERFVLYINSRARATRAAIFYSIISVQQGIRPILMENVNYSLQPMLGKFVYVVDDGSGNPPAKLMDGVAASVEEYRGFTIEAIGRRPVEIFPVVSLNVKIASGASVPKTLASVKSAVLDHMNTRAIKETLFAGQIVKAAESVDGCNGVDLTTGPLINGGHSDLVPTGIQIVRGLSNNITVGTY